MFPRVTIQGGHEYWSRTDGIANVCNTGIDTGNPHVQKIYSCLIYMSLMRVQCVAAFKICAITFMLGIIRWLSLNQYYKMFRCKQVDSLEEIISLVLSETDGFTCQENCSF